MPNEDEAEQVFNQLGNLSQPQLKKIGPKLAARLDQDALSAVWESFVDATPRDQTTSLLRQTIKRLPDAEKTNAVVGAIEQLSTKQQQQIVHGVVRSLDQPSAPTRDRLWLIVVIAFCIVFVGSAMALALCVFIAVPKDNKASPELLLAMFTSVVGFLAGLFVPSPSATSNTSASRNAPG